MLPCLCWKLITCPLLTPFPLRGSSSAPSSSDSSAFSSLLHPHLPLPLPFPPPFLILFFRRFFFLSVLEDVHCVWSTCPELSHDSETSGSGTGHKSDALTFIRSHVTLCNYYNVHYNNVLTVVKVVLPVHWKLLMRHSVELIHVLTPANTWKSSTCVYQVRNIISLIRKYQVMHTGLR